MDFPPKSANVSVKALQRSARFSVVKWGVEVSVRSVTFLNKARAPRCQWESPWRASLGGGSGLRRGLVTLVISSPPFKVCKVFNNPERGMKEDCSGPSVQRLLFEQQRQYLRIYFEDKKQIST